MLPLAPGPRFPVVEKPCWSAADAEGVQVEVRLVFERHAGHAAGRVVAAGQRLSGHQLAAREPAPINVGSVFAMPLAVARAAAWVDRIARDEGRHARHFPSAQDVLSTGLSSVRIW